MPFITLIALLLAAEPDLRHYQTKYYIINTDLPPQVVEEAAVRMMK